MAPVPTQKKHLMNNKFHGNSLDLFKYDIISRLVQEGERLFYVPMLTEPLPKERNFKYLTYELGTQNKILYDYLRNEFLETEYSHLGKLSQFFNSLGIQHKMIGCNTEDAGMPLIISPEINFFSEANRKEYFSFALKNYKMIEGSTFLFFDPDVGSDVGIRRRFRSNKHMYIRKIELRSFLTNLKDGDYIGFFQHLGNANYKIENRINDLKEVFGQWVLIIGYERIQAGMVIIFKEESTYHNKLRIIDQYFQDYHYLEHRDKFIINGKPLNSSGFRAL